MNGVSKVVIFQGQRNLHIAAHQKWLHALTTPASIQLSEFDVAVRIH
jgi:hypothetical protein